MTASDAGTSGCRDRRTKSRRSARNAKVRTGIRHGNPKSRKARNVGEGPMASSPQNKFCKLSNLRNESDVEQNFLVHLLDELGFTEDYRKTKSSILAAKIGKGKKRREYSPDYVCYLDKSHTKPVLIVDAKSPNADAEDGVEDAQLYASVMRRTLSKPKPDQFCMGSNGHVSLFKHHDSNETFLELLFEEFRDVDPKFTKLKSTLAREPLQAATKRLLAQSDPWIPVRASVEEIKAVFDKCHNHIWKRESLLPTAAFYEFTKLIFLKLREDERLHRMLDTRKEIRLKDLYFHTGWIDDNSEVSPNPVNSILFRRLIENLEDQIRRHKKKPIFDANEQINLKPSTIRAIIELLQDYDLSEIDEDLNGRMFEVFLSAAVRGKNLGAFFTPRNAVELMVHMASPSITRIGGQAHIETVLDGCCGSGGFLIDAMATMLEQIKSNPALSPISEDLRDKLLNEHLYGIENNPDITRIARINMFLHGDGGSRIYRADTLDKEFLVEEGEARVSQDEINELKQVIVTQAKKFDVVLTNPPFASAYTSTDEHQRRILSQYSDLHADAQAAKPRSSAKSNVLFLARYYDLLRPGGRMVIVLDNSMLNSHNFAEYRVWLRRKFIIRAVISLPKYSFIQAGAGGVTSILYLEKRTSTGQSQPPIFARTVNYTGISKSGKEIEENDLPDVLKEWRAFERTGKLSLKGQQPIRDRKLDELFLIFPGEIKDRIDVSYHSPSFSQLLKRIEAMAKTGTHEVKFISDFNLADKVEPEEADEVFRYVDIGAIDAERCQIIRSEVQEGTLAELSDRARVRLKENDVIFPLSFDSLGKVAIIPQWLDGQLASTGFIAIRNKNYDEAVLLWAIIRSEVMQKQFHHLASGYTQRGISKEHLNELRFPIPVRNRGDVIEGVKKFLVNADSSRKTELIALGGVTALMDKVLTS